MGIPRVLRTGVIEIGLASLLAVVGFGIYAGVIDAKSLKNPRQSYQHASVFLPERCGKVTNGGAIENYGQFLFCENPEGGYSLFTNSRNVTDNWSELVYK